jgi:hypothetical protein
MKRLLLFLMTAGFLLMFNLSDVYACSGGYEYPTKTLDDMLGSVFVLGTVIENSGGNSIIQVERYLTSGGPRYLFVHRQDPEIYVTRHVRGYDFGCSYALSSFAQVGTRAYFSLYGSANGTYGVDYYASQYNKQASLPLTQNEEGQTVVDYSELVDGVAVIDRPTLDEFEQIVAERVGHPSTEPVGSQMPRFRFLRITTESGQNYQLSLHQDEIYPVEITNTACVENCPIVSPDGSHFLSPIPNETDAYWFWYTPRPS